MQPTSQDLQIGKTFRPVVLGADVLGYSYTRQFHETYGVDSIVLAKYDIKFTSRSKWNDYRCVDGVEREEELLAYLKETIAPECRAEGRKPLLVASGDWYAEILSKNKSELTAAGFAVPYNDYSLFSVITMKEKFYGLCSELGIPYPKTWLVACGEGLDPIPGIDVISDEVIDGHEYPMIVKPANSAEWHYAEFEGKRKIHTVNSPAELRKLISDVKGTSYSKYLLVQECLAVRDDSLHSVTVFCEHGEMTLGRVGHVLVQDRSAKGIGNPLVILGEDCPDLLDCAARLCKKVGYEGYGNFDVMDGADGKPRFLEINARPGRNTYYMTLAGVPFVKPIVEKFVCGNDTRQSLTSAERACDRPFLFCVPPYDIVRKEVTDPVLKQGVEESIKAGVAKSPLLNSEDSLAQRLYARLNRVNFHSKF